MGQTNVVRDADAPAQRMRRPTRRARRALVAVGATAALAALAPAANAAVNTLPLTAPVPGTLADTGFSTVLTGSTFDAAKLSVSGTGLAVLSENGSDAYLGLNDQVNALALPVDPGSQGISAKVDVSLPNPSAQQFQSAGVLVGQNQDNYVKLVISVRKQGGSGATVAALNFLYESGGAVKAVANTSIPGLPPTGNITLILAVAPNGDVTPQYQLDGGPVKNVSADPCLRGSLGCTFTGNFPELLKGSTTAGIVATNYDDFDDPSTTPPFTATFKNFVLDNPNQTGAAPSTPVTPPAGGPGGGVNPNLGPVPKILAVAPGPNGEVARRGRIVLEFDRPVRVPATSIRLVRGNGLVLPANVTYVSRLNQVVVTPNKPLPLTGGVVLAVSGGTNPAAVSTAAGATLATNARYKLKVVKKGALPLRGFDVRGKFLDLVLTSNAAPKSLSARQGATLAKTRTKRTVVRKDGKNWTITLKASSGDRYVRVIQTRKGKAPLRTVVFLPKG